MDRDGSGFPSLLAFSSEILLVVGGDGIIHRAQGAVGRLGIDARRVEGRPFASLFFPAEQAAAWLERRFREGGADGWGAARLTCRRPDGGQGLVAVTAFNRLNDTEVAGVVVRVRDGEERDPDEFRQIDMGTAFLTLAESAPCGIFRTDDRGRIILANACLSTLSGLSADHLLEKGWFSAVHPGDRERVGAEWRLSLATRQGLLIDFRFAGPDGMAIPVLLQSAPLPPRQGVAGGMVGTVTDMSEYVRTAEALTAAQARTDAVMDAAADAVLTVDEAGIIHSYNRAAARMFGIAAADALWHRIDRLLPDLFDQGRDGLADTLLAMAGTHTDRRDGLLVTRADGAVFPIDLSVSMMETDKRRLFIVIARDVTEQCRVQDELLRAKEAAEAADRAKTAFLAVMSHELRTPLNAVIGFAQLIESRMLRPLSEERYVEYAQAIRHSGEHLLGLIEQILDISKIEAGFLDLDEGVVDPAVLVGDTLNLLALEAGRKGVALDVSLSPGLPLIWADSLRLRQVLVNLLSNGIKFTETGGCIGVGARVSGAGGLALWVRDTGPGIPPEDIPRVLAPFGQLDQSVTRIHGGTGLGLPLSKRLVERHGGALLIDSTIGNGTTVSVFLPPSRVMPSSPPSA